jgi:Restriction endonuclease S subunits
MTQKVKNIPELRFPEFVNEGEWKIEPLGSLSDEILEKTKGRKFKLMSITSGFGLVSQIEKFGREIAGDSYKNYYVIHKGDFAYNKSSTKLYGEGEIAMYGDNETGAVPNSIFTCFRFYQNKIYPLFAKYPFVNNLHGTWLKKFIAVGARANGALQVNVKDLFSLPFPYPTIQEQQKIASCLSSLDEIITTHNQKLEILKERKKGLMQNLFPQKGKKAPKYRFPEFENDGEWVENTLGGVATFVNGRAYKQEELLDSGKYRVLRVGNFFTNNNWYYSDLELEEDKYCDFGDLLYAWSASFGPRIWKGEKVIYHYHIWKVIPTKRIDKDFLFILLDNETERMKTQNANGFALLHITKGTIENWKCCIPENIEEQQKIASCLLALDELITSQTEKIEQLKQHKKGLMQGLFPKMNN